MYQALVQGFLTSLSLIGAIGSQNAFVLRQGLLGAHIVTVCLICAICDFVLMAIGILGLGVTLREMPWVAWGLGIAGTLFLMVYGFRAFRSALRGGSSLDVEAPRDSDAQSRLVPVVLTTFAVTLLNPHVYLDTVVVVGGIATSLAPDHRVAFLIGTSLASTIWFFGFGLGARFLRPIFSRPSAWRVLDAIIACIMWSVAAVLARYVLENIPS